MKYCLPYDGSKIMSELDELIIAYDNNVDEAIQRVLSRELVPKSRIIFAVKNIREFKENNQHKFFIELKNDKKYNEYNFALKFPRESKDFYDIYEELKENDIPFFFDSYVRDWDTLYYYINLGVSDVYIVEALAFELNLLGPVAHEKGISIRAFANVCQGLPADSNPLKSFFIRPEDVFVYEKYIDVLEFYGEPNIQQVAYKVYAHDKKWSGSLNELIIGLEKDIDNRQIIPIFGAMRTKCGKRCIKGQTCSICNHTEAIATHMAKNNTFFRKK